MVSVDDTGSPITYTLIPITIGGTEQSPTFTYNSGGDKTQVDKTMSQIETFVLGTGTFTSAPAKEINNQSTINTIQYAGIGPQENDILETSGAKYLVTKAGSTFTMLPVEYNSGNSMYEYDPGEIISISGTDANLGDLMSVFYAPPIDKLTDNTEITNITNAAARINEFINDGGVISSNVTTVSHQFDEKVRNRV